MALNNLQGLICHKKTTNRLQLTHEVQWQKCCTAISWYASSNPSSVITLIFRPLALGKMIFIHASHQAELDNRYFSLWGFREEGGSARVLARALLVNASHRFTRCNVNYSCHCNMSRHVCQVTLLVIDSLDPNV